MKFQIENNVLIRFVEEKGDKNVIIPEGVTEVAEEAFAKCKEVESVTFPSSVTFINPYSFYYTRNLKWVECNSEVSIVCDHAFPACKKMDYLVCNPNTPLSKLPSKWKRMLAIGVMKYVSDGNDITPEALKEAKTYIVGQSKKLELYKLGYEYPFVAKFMIDQKILSEELYDEMVGYAQENQLTDLLTMLIEGKSEQYPAEGLFDRIEKKMNKEASLEKKMNDPTSTAYLKTQWSWKKHDDGTLIIWTYKGNDSEVYIPAIVGKNKVSAIRGHLFQAGSFERDEWIRLNVNKIHIAEGIASIGGEGYYGMYDGPIAYFDIPTEVYIPASVNHICWNAFASKRYDDSEHRDVYKIVNVTIHAPAGSYAETYAKENNIPLVIE